MKKLLFAGFLLGSASSVACAADIVETPVYDWSGFYIVGNLGAAFNSSTVDEDVNSGDLGELGKELKDKVQSNETVFTGGGGIGANWQFNHLVLGAETDINYTGFDDSTDRSRDIGEFGTVHTDLELKADWFGTIRGRLGYAADNWLFYGTGGLAYGNVHADGKVKFDNGDSFRGDDSSTNWGWTVGGGAEVALHEHWIIGAEVLYVDLGSSDFDFNNPAANKIHEKINGHINEAFTAVRATLKYKF